MLRISLCLVVPLIIPHLLCASANGEVDVEVVQRLINRLLPQYSDRFVLEELGFDDAIYGAFEIDSDAQESTIILRGTSGVELASALNWYLKDYCSAMVSWTGDQLELPEPLPLPSRRRTERTMKYTYYQNTCTASYSFAFYDWQRWEREIDWMALNGINFPLAFNGQELIFALTYERFNISFEDLGDFFAGPAFQTWQRMGNINEWGGPQSLQFVKDQADLQIRILKRMRSFGMTPILTAFSGFVPRKLTELYPGANFTKAGWGDPYSDTFLLDTSDPLFLEIGSAFIEIQERIYGTDHFYNTDTFNENTPPSNETEYLRSSAHAVYESMRLGDPDAVWIMQGWLFYNAQSFWGLPQVEGLLSGVPDDRMIILDLFTDTFPVWQDVNGFFGKPFIWCELHNFGGQLGMHGRTQVIAKDVLRDFRNPNITMIGIGLTMEGINQNYIVYDLMLEQAYRTEATNLTSWTSEDGGSSWVGRRYGARVVDNAVLFDHLSSAWSTLQQSVYSGDAIRTAPTALATNPTLDGPVRLDRVEIKILEETFVASAGVPLDAQGDLFFAWSELVEAARMSMSSPSSLSTDSPPLADSDTFAYDLVDVTREVLTTIFKEFRFQFSQGYHSHNLTQVQHYAPLMLGLIEDLDEVLCSHHMFLLGAWLQDARRLAPQGNEDQFEFNARNQITLWGPQLPLNDYATKQWCGMVGDYFYNRYRVFTEEVISAVEQSTSFDPAEFNSRMLDYGLAWDQQTDPGGVDFPNTPRGSSIEIALRLSDKYASTRMDVTWGSN